MAFPVEASVSEAAVLGFWDAGVSVSAGCLGLAVFFDSVFGGASSSFVLVLAGASVCVVAFFCSGRTSLEVAGSGASVIGFFGVRVSVSACCLGLRVCSCSILLGALGFSVLSVEGASVCVIASG